MTGRNAGKMVFIPRISLEPTDTQVPFKFVRRQFPVRLCFGMSINKSQGQSVKHVGLALDSGVFTHGQFYVGVSRVTSVRNLRMIWDSWTEVAVTKNIVYPEVLLD